MPMAMSILKPTWIRTQNTILYLIHIKITSSLFSFLPSLSSFSLFFTLFSRPNTSQNRYPLFFFSQAMLLTQPNRYHFHASFVFNPPKLPKPIPTLHQAKKVKGRKEGGRRLVVRACQGEKKKEKRSFLSLEEAGLVEITGLSTHERFLCRLTISSLNLLRVISEQEGLPIEELNAGRICDWFVKDKLKREQDKESAVLQWDESELQF